VASREVDCSAECYEHRSSEHIGLLTPTRNSLFPVVLWFFPDVVPHLLAKLGSSSRELHLPFRVRPASSPPDALTPNTSPGSLSHSRHQHVKSTSDEHPKLTFVPSTAFLTLSTGYSFTSLASLFHLTTTSGIRTSGVIPRCQVTRLIDELSPHVVGETLLPAGCPTGARSFRVSFRVCPSSDPLQLAGGLDLPTTRSPLGLSTLSGFSPNT